MAALFQNIALPNFPRGASFRKACRSQAERKNQIQTLEVSICRLWLEWFRWDSAISSMVSLREITVRAAGNENDDPWDVFKFTAKIAPNVQWLSICLDSERKDAYPTFCLPALRRIDLNVGDIDTKLLEVLARSLPAVSTVLIYSESQIIDPGSLEALATFPRLATLRIDFKNPFGLRDNEREEPLEFPCLTALSMGIEHNLVGVRDDGILAILTECFLPSLRHLEINLPLGTVDAEEGMNRFARLSFPSANRLPRLSVVDVLFWNGKDDTPRFEPIFVPLGEAGFTFELEEEPQEGCPLQWRARRGEYVTKPFPEFA